MKVYFYCTYSITSKLGLLGLGSVSAQSLLSGNIWDFAVTHTKARITPYLERKAQISRD
jgi:hypothetical protein